MNTFQLYEAFMKESLPRKIEHLTLLFLVFILLKKLTKQGGIRKNLSKNFVRFFTQNKIIKKGIDKILVKESQKAIKSLLKGKETPQINEIPDDGWKHDKILEYMDQKKQGDLNPYQGKSFAYIYQFSKEHNILTEQAYHKFIHTNVLNPLKFNSIRNMEIEVVAMTAKMFNGDSSFVGTVTSGGSESILLAVKAYRDYFKSQNSQIDYEPEVILCETAHPAFMKAAQLFNVKLVLVDADKDYKMKIDETKKQINERTCLIVVSAPQYAHGIIDPIEEISEIGYQMQIPVHVDSAIGGYVLPWMEKLGQKIPKFDFRCRGVSSINADVHKFGFAPKGSSVLVYRNQQHRISQFSTYSQWCGGMYVSPTLLGTRNGGPLAAAWASLVGIGKSGFMDVNKKMLETVNYLKKSINDMPELEVLGDPLLNIMAFTSKKGLNIYHLADALEERGYHMERQQNPDCLHCTLMMQHYQFKENLIQDIKECVEIVKQNPQKYSGSDGSAAMYGMLGKIPDGAIVDEFLCQFLNQMYSFKNE